MNANELVIELHNLARNTNDTRIRKIADDLAEIAKNHSDKGYEVCSLEDAEKFAEKRDESLREYREQAMELWNDSCTSVRGGQSTEKS